MQQAPNWPEVRTRLKEAIASTYGNVSTSSMSSLADKSGVSYSTVARFIHHYDDPNQQTNSMQRSTVNQLAPHLNSTSNYLLYAVGSKQQGFWPRLAEPETELNDYDPVADVIAAVRKIRHLESQTQIRLCRAIIVGLLNTTFQEGVRASGDLHEALIRVDATIERQADDAAAVG